MSLRWLSPYADVDAQVWQLTPSALSLSALSLLLLKPKADAADDVVADVKAAAAAALPKSCRC
jgi:uncharacterized protein (DUF2252 family)